LIEARLPYRILNPNVESLTEYFLLKNVQRQSYDAREAGFPAV
jgi:hypothetical protein